MNSDSLRQITVSAALVLACASGGIAVLRFGQLKLQEARLRHAQETTALKNVQDQYAQAAQEGPVIQATIRRFEEMRERGLIGPENRLQWADSVRRITLRLKLQDASFSFSPQRSLRALGSSGSYEVNASTLTWHARLLHEGDLLRVLDDFQKAPNATVVVKRCSIADLAPAGTAQTANAAGLSPSEITRPVGDTPVAIPYSLVADCELDWITISEASSSRSHSEPTP